MITFFDHLLTSSGPGKLLLDYTVMSYDTEMGLFFTKWTKWSFVLRNGAFFPPFCNFYSVFMISVISDCKNIIKYDFAVLESYFIYNLCEISDEMEFYFSKWSMFFPFLQLLFCFYDFYHI